MNADGVQYPEARSPSGRRVHIADVGPDGRRGPFYCYGCDQPLIPRATESAHVRPHFAHKVQSNPDSCDPDNALHRAAVANILEGFAEAVESGSPYLVSIPCAYGGPACQRAIEIDVSGPGARAVAEVAAVAGTRADVAIYGPAEWGNALPRWIIEVVVTHDLESDTRARYVTSGIPLAQVAPTWESLDDLRSGVSGFGFLNVSRRNCAGCAGAMLEYLERAAEAERGREAERAAAELLAAQARAALAVIAPRPDLVIKPAPIAIDRAGHRLRRVSRENLTSAISRLIFLGFEQHNHDKPYLARIRLPERTDAGRRFAGDRHTVYVDYGGNDLRRVWDPEFRPRCYAWPDDAMGAALAVAAARRLETFGIEAEV